MEEDDFAFSIYIVFPFLPCRQTLSLHRDGRTGECGGKCRKVWAEEQKKKGWRLKDSEHYFHCLHETARVLKGPQLLEDI